LMGVREHTRIATMTAPVLVLHFVIVSAAGALLACNSPVTVCPAILYMKPTVPDTTTIKVGAATIAIAGAIWGGCDLGPPPPDFVWASSDSSIATVAALDSVHARIQGRRPGIALIQPTYRVAKPVRQPDPVRVTVVP